MPKNNNNISLGDLATMVQQGFAETHEKMATKKELQEVKKEIYSINSRLSDIEQVLAQHTEQLQHLNSEVVELKKVAWSNEADTHELDRRVTALEKEVGLKS